MFGYRCDYCGKILYVDPQEERICDECFEIKRKRHVVARRYTELIRMNGNDYEMNMEEMQV